LNLASPRALLAGMAGLSLLAVAAALYTQYAWAMQPCAWCVLQRLVFVAVAAAALLGLAMPGANGRRGAAALAMLLADLGLAAALWQHFVANRSASCNMSLADKVMGATGLDRTMPEVFAAYASCAEAKVDLAGLPYEWWSAALFTLLSLAALRVVLRPG
jgi:disulfide bond formation protein DsbB